jgi:hypothetical protein
MSNTKSKENARALVLWTALTELATLKLELIDARATTKRMNKASYETIAKLELRLTEASDVSEKLDRLLNKTIDAHEVTKQRLLGYENEAGVPMREADRKIYLQGGKDYNLNK